MSPNQPPSITERGLEVGGCARLAQIKHCGDVLAVEAVGLDDLVELLKYRFWVVGEVVDCCLALSEIKNDFLFGEVFDLEARDFLVLYRQALDLELVITHAFSVVARRNIAIGGVNPYIGRRVKLAADSPIKTSALETVRG